MPSAQARIRTDRAGRYLTQMCRHTTHVGGLGHGDRHGAGGGTPVPRRTEYSDTAGTIDFDRGRCILRATGEELTLLAEADDQQDLRQIQDAITVRLTRVGRRDRISVTWQPAPAPPGGETGDPATILGRLMTPEGRADPFPLYAAAHQLGPVSPLPGGAFLVCGYAAADQVLRDPGFGLAEPAGPDPGDGAVRLMNQSILRANPPDHGRMRSLIAQVFTPRRVAGLRPAIEAAVGALIDQLIATAGGEPVDFKDQFAFPLPVTVIGELLGVPPGDRRRFRPLAAGLTEALEPAGGASATADAAARELAAYFVPLIGARRAAPGADLVSALVAARDADDGRLTDRELLANLILLLVAGFETTTSLLGNGLALLLDRPALAGSLRAGQIPVPAFIEEVLRYDSPVQAVTRRARAHGRTIGDVPVPYGSDLILLIGAANRDPARYRDPDGFDPTRTDVRPLSFGAGAHICIGNSLARLEADVAFRQLLGRLPAMTAAPGRPALRRDRLVLRGYQTLPVRIHPAG
jgi:cytochrome P450